MPSISYWENDKNAFNANGVQNGSGTLNLSFQRLSIPNQISATRMDLVVAQSVAGSSVNTLTYWAGLYTMAGSTMSMASSSSLSVSFTSGTNSTAASVYGAHSGTRFRSVPTGTWNVTPGEYMLGVMVSWGGAGASMTMYGGSSLSVIQDIGATNGNSAYFADGLFSAGTGAFPASVHLSAIIQSRSEVFRQPYVRLVGTF
jgi:hypothetical protein